MYVRIPFLYSPIIKKELFLPKNRSFKSKSESLRFQPKIMSSLDYQTDTQKHINLIKAFLSIYLKI